MDIKSEKRWKLVPVTDIDVVYLGGMHDQITYTAQDHILDTPESLSVWIVDPATGHTVEQIVCLKRNICSYKFRDRQLRIEDTSPLPTIEGDAPTGA
jgi:hypothetical protein